MMFLVYLKENGFLCHDVNDIAVGPDRQLSCRACHRLILDVHKHLTSDTLPMLSTFLAKHYAAWTGDVHVPCRIIVKDIPGIQSSYVEISYFNLMNTLELLGTVNQDFILCKNHPFDVKSTLKAKILENFIDYYMTMVEGIDYEKESVEKILKAILTQLKNTLSTHEYNIFDYYFKVICPYVKTFDRTVREESLDVDCPGEFFLHLSKNATEIRNHFGKYCLPFDIIYVMIYCFACHKNLNVVVNFVCDLVARLCNGYFDHNTTPYQQKCRRLLNTLVSYDKHTQLYYTVKEIQKGKASESFSLDFYNKFAKLQHLLYGEFVKTTSTPSETVTKFAFSQSFPYILFPNSANYYGFLCMMGYATSKLNSANFEKGTCTNAREICRFIENYAQRIARFANGTFLTVSEIKNVLLNASDSEFKTDVQKAIAGKNIHDMKEDDLVCIYPKVEFWTLDHFNLFVSKDEDILNHLATFLGLLVQA